MSKLEELEEKVAAHVEAYTVQVERARRREDALFKATEDNAAAIANLTASTQGLVDGWQAAQAFQRFIKWISSFAIVVAGLAWLSTKFSSIMAFFK